MIAGLTMQLQQRGYDQRMLRRLLPRRSHPLLDAPLVYRGRDDELAAAYARSVAGDPLPFIQERYREGMRWRQVVHAILGHAPSRVLDLGAGNGAIGLAMSATGESRVVAVDRLLQRGVVAADALALPLADASIDAILCLETIEHIPPPALPAFTTEMARVLRRDGLILITTPPRWRYLLRPDPHFDIRGLLLLPPSLQRAVAARRGFGETHHYVGQMFSSVRQIARLFPGFTVEVLSRSRAPRRWFWDALVLRRNSEDAQVIEGFGREWQTFTHTDAAAEDDLRRAFDSYFQIFPWRELPPNAVGADVGCGTGRWARLVAPRVGKLYCVEPSAALEVARRALAGAGNCEFVSARADAIPLADQSLDFAYCLGVLHHVSNTEESLAAIVRKLKPGAPMLLYLYYALETRPLWYRALWRISDVVRRVVSRMPYPIRLTIATAIAAGVYWPLARIARNDRMPLATYRTKRFYFMRADALDRFGTRVEKRYTRAQIAAMMERAGLERIEFSEAGPYWVAVGRTPAASPADRETARCRRTN